ncbi:MAG: type II toxin-antitoxin system VapC family toxin [Chitinophagales bacterium]|nr:type II toxin-antitoxin system VapC family toxin [Chitinophagales bacterium]
MTIVLKKGSSKKDKLKAWKQLTEEIVSKGVNTLKYCGTVNFNEDGLSTSKKDGEMSGNEILLDTNIIIYLLNGDSELAEFLMDKKLYVSFVSEIELIGFPDITEVQAKGIQSFLDECIPININNQIKKETIRIRRDFNVKIPDSIVIASAICMNIPVFTSDKQFGKVSGLNVLMYQ